MVKGIRKAICYDIDDFKKVVVFSSDDIKYDDKTDGFTGMLKVNFKNCDVDVLRDTLEDYLEEIYYYED